jgi:hypothetical protein
MRLVFVVVCSIVRTSKIVGRGNIVVDFLILSLGYCLVLGLCKYFRHRSYVILSNVLAMEAFVSPRFSNTNPFRSCYGYCLTPHKHFSS